MRVLINVMLLQLIFNLWSSETCSQNNSDIAEVLNTAFVDNAVKFKNAKNYQLGALDYAVPLLEKVEVRSETNDFDIRKQDLTVRVSPNGRSTRKAHRLYHESVMFMAEMEYKTEIMKVLLEKYHLIKDFVFSKEILQIEKEKNEVALDKVKLLKKMISLSSFDIVELIEAEDNVYKLQRRIQSIESNLANLKIELTKLLAKEEITIELKDIISVQNIKTYLALGKLTAENSHPAEKVLSAKHYNEQMEYEWEASKNNFSIGFLQASYGHDPEDPFRSNFSLGVGFDIPIKGSTRLDLNEIRVNILDAQSEYLDLGDQIVSNKQTSRSKLMRLISMYELLSVQIEEGNANHALVEYSRQGVASPRAILKLKELTIDNESLLVEIRSEIMDTYLDYIYNTGAIGIVPYPNYFDEELTTLQ